MIHRDTGNTYGRSLSLECPYPLGRHASNFPQPTSLLIGNCTGPRLRRGKHIIRGVRNGRWRLERSKRRSLGRWKRYCGPILVANRCESRLDTAQNPSYSRSTRFLVWNAVWSEPLWRKGLEIIRCGAFLASDRSRR